MGAAYERTRPADPGRTDGPDGARDQGGDQDMWDALDRRIDPTGDNKSRMED